MARLVTYGLGAARRLVSFGLGLGTSGPSPNFHVWGVLYAIPGASGVLYAVPGTTATLYEVIT